MSKAEKIKSPEVDKIETMIDQLTADYDAATNGDVMISVAEVEEILDMLKWAAQFLGDRKLYHKTQQKKKAIIQKLIKEHLSADDLKHINEQAAKAASKEVE